MEKSKEKVNKVVQTYAEDMAKVLENEKGGLIKKIIQGEEQHEAEKKNLSPESKKNEFFMLFGALLVVASIATLFFFFFKKEIPSVPVEEQFVPIIFTDKSSLVEVADLEKPAIEQKVLDQAKASTVKVGGVEGIYLTINKSPVGLRKFIEIISGNFLPGSTNFVSDNFLMGIVNNKILATISDAPASPTPGTGEDKPTSPLRDAPALPTSKDFFLLLKVRSVADVFEIMRAWETKMFTDLHGFVGIPLSPETKYLLTKSFEDGVVENKNARILYKNGDSDGNKIALMYVFADDNSVIIANSEDAVQEIILRLASSEVKK